MFNREMQIAGFDDALWDAMQKEVARQEAHIELIASENYASPRVMQAQGTQLTNKYAEGYPGKRYYGGCEHVDVVEQMAIDYAKELFDATYANVQPHSGSQANGAVFQALVKPGDTVLGMSLDAGGHLTHGAKPSFSGKHYNAVQYGIDESGRIDYDEVAKLAREHQPKMIIAGFSAYSQELDFARFRAIADKVGAYLFVDMAHVAGLVAAGVYPDPMPHAHVVTTTTHKTLRGPRGGLILACDDEDLHKKLNSAVFPGGQGGPLMHIVAAKAVAFREALRPEFKEYASRVVDNARALAASLEAHGLRIVSGGTDNHSMLVDLTAKDVTGKDAEKGLDRAFLTCNKNGIPFDTRSPFITSGLRLGSPAGTTRGFGTDEFTKIGELIARVVEGLAKNGPEGDAQIEQAVRAEVGELCAAFPVYPGR